MNTDFLWPKKAKAKHDRLFNLLSEHCLDSLKTANGVLCVRAFAEYCGLSHEGVYRWLRTDFLPQKNIKLVMAACDIGMTVEMLLPYTYKI
jgi:hypothetical protein